MTDKTLIELIDTYAEARHKHGYINANTEAALSAVVAALAQQAGAPTPVAWRYEDARGHYRYRGYQHGRDFAKEYPLLKPIPLYATPQPAPAAEWHELPGQMPKTGTPVLLDIGKEFPIRAMWAAKHTVRAAGDDTDWGEYSEEQDEYFAPEGWYEWNQNEDSHWRVSETPIAWCDLPPPPARKG